MSKRQRRRPKPQRHTPTAEKVETAVNVETQLPHPGRDDGGPVTPPSSMRNPWLDAIRGLAIVLMLIDHGAGSWFDAKIATSDVRFWTRFSLPLFCVLMGFLIAARPRFHARRFLQIVLASVLVNLIYWPQHQEMEVLASLAITQVLATLLLLSPFSLAAGPLLVATLALYQWDAIAWLFDYQLTLVGCLVGQGIVLRCFGWPVALLTGVGLTWAGFSGQFIHELDTHHLVFAFLVPATILIAIADRIASCRMPSWSGLDGLALIGMYPLTIYVTHYYFIAVTTRLFRG